jgi:hypothetical protein
MILRDTGSRSCERRDSVHHACCFLTMPNTQCSEICAGVVSSAACGELNAAYFCRGRNVNKRKQIGLGARKIKYLNLTADSAPIFSMF